MMFSKCSTQSVNLRGTRGHKPPEDGVLQHLQRVLSLNIDDTELNVGRSFDSIYLELGRTVVPIEDWSCIVFGPIRSHEGGSWELRKFENF